MNLKKTTQALFLLFTTSFGFSQAEGSNFNSTGKGVSTTFATDYQALGINPANLGWTRRFEKKWLAFGAGETSFSLESKLLNNQVIKDVRSFPLSFNVGNNHTYNEFATLSEDLQDGMRINFDARLFGIAITTKKLGGFAFSINEKYRMNLNLSKDFADISTHGFGAPYFDSLIVQKGSLTYSVLNNPTNFDSLQNDNTSNIIAGKATTPKSIPSLMNGTDFSISWIREFQFGYGRKIIDLKALTIYGGIGVKYLQGMALFDLNTTATSVSGFASYSSTFQDLKNGILSGGTAQLSLPKAAGTGYGIDLGVNIQMANKLKIGFAINDMGSITWTKNTYSISSTATLDSLKTGGISATPSTSGTASFDSILNQLVDIQTTNVTKKVNLPTMMRLGASIQLGKVLEIGAEMVSPFNNNPGSFSNTIYSIGGDLKLGPLKLSAGAVLKENQILRIPVGIGFEPLSGTVEMGISTRDIKSLINFNTTENPMISLAFGFLRFRI